MFRHKVALLAMPFALGLVTAASRHPVSAPMCKVAAEWVAKNRETLPTTLGDLSTYPMAYRRAIVNALPRATRMQLWHDQFAHYLEGTALTLEQRAYVEEVDNNFDHLYGTENVAAAKPTIERGKRILGKDLYGAIMETLGTVSSKEAKLGDGSTILSASGVPGCNCNVNDSWCNPTTAPNYCVGGGCDGMPAGCGSWWCESCNGGCSMGNAF